MFIHDFNYVEVITLNSVLPAQTCDRKPQTVYPTWWPMIKTFQSRINHLSSSSMPSVPIHSAVLLLLNQKYGCPALFPLIFTSCPVNLFYLPNISISQIHPFLPFPASVVSSVSHLVSWKNFPTGLLVFNLTPPFICSLHLYLSHFCTIC